MAISIESDKPTFRSGSHWIAGEDGFPQLTATGSTGTVNWDDGGAGGVFVPTTGTNVEYQPPNATQTVVITATDTLGNDSTTISVEATVPINAFWGGEGGIDRETTVQKAKGGVNKYYRESDATEHDEQLNFHDVEKPEHDAIKEFWQFHRKVKPFWYYDTDTQEIFWMRFTSGLRWRKTGGDSTSIFANVVGLDNTISLDTEKPTVQIITPAAAQVVAGSVPIQAAASDNVAVKSVTFSVDAAEIETRHFPPWRVVWDSTTVANGSRVIKAVAKDTADNVSLDATVNVTVDN